MIVAATRGAVPELERRGGGAIVIIASVEGSYTNVIGLPMERLYTHLRRWRVLP